MGIIPLARKLIVSMILIWKLLMFWVGGWRKWGGIEKWLLLIFMCLLLNLDQDLVKSIIPIVMILDLPASLEFLSSDIESKNCLIWIFELFCVSAIQPLTSYYPLSIKRYHSVLSLLDGTFGSHPIRKFLIFNTSNIWNFNFVSILPVLLRKIFYHHNESNIHDFIISLPSFAPAFLGGLTFSDKFIVKFEFITLSLLYSLSQ